MHALTIDHKNFEVLLILCSCFGFKMFGWSFYRTNAHHPKGSAISDSHKFESHAFVNTPLKWQFNGTVSISHCFLFVLV